MQDKTIYIFRHGITQGATRGYYHWDYWHARVLEHGFIPVRKIAKFLSDKDVEVIYSSPFMRCMETAAIISDATNIPIQSDPGLRDVLTPELSVERRIKKFYQMLEKTDHKKIAICTHAGVFKYLVKFYNGEKIPQYKKGNVPTGVLVVLKDGKVSFQDFNITK